MKNWMKNLKSLRTDKTRHGHADSEHAEMRRAPRQYPRYDIRMGDRFHQNLSTR
ncbi:hypothetical protein [Janibacter corallicola]|uniref:hypothetical protein n=1 Tax=Janibacter corallicola TaxID=415212 RepID=UPI000B2A730E|nr:hypothetical protein [Janibacter corallicola]